MTDRDKITIALIVTISAFSTGVLFNLLFGLIPPTRGMFVLTSVAGVITSELFARRELTFSISPKDRKFLKRARIVIAILGLIDVLIMVLSKY